MPEARPRPTRHGIVPAMDDSALLQTLTAALRRLPGVELALLFGSRATGRATELSDVDVAVLGAELDILEVARVLSAAARCEVDVVRLDRASIPLLGQLVRDAITIHEGSPGAAARWRHRALLQLETDGPWYARQRDAWLAHVAEHGV